MPESEPAGGGASSPGRAPRLLVAVVFRDGAFRLGQVQEGVEGHWPLDALGPFRYEAAARREARRLNARLGWNIEEAERAEATALRRGPYTVEELEAMDAASTKTKKTKKKET